MSFLSGFNRIPIVSQFAFCIMATIRLGHLDEIVQEPKETNSAKRDIEVEFVSEKLNLWWTLGQSSLIEDEATETHLGRFLEIHQVTQGSTRTCEPNGREDEILH